MQESYKTTYKHIQPKGIQKNPKNDGKMLRSYSLAITSRILLCRHSFKNKTHTKSIKKQNTTGNKRHKKSKKLKGQLKNQL